MSGLAGLAIGSTRATLVVLLGGITIWRLVLLLLLLLMVTVGRVVAAVLLLRRIRRCATLVVALLVRRGTVTRLSGRRLW